MNGFHTFGPTGPTAWAYAQDIPCAKKFLLVTLAGYADERWSCFPGQARLARDIGQSDRNVRGLLSELERDGFIRRESRMKPDGRGRTSDRIFLIADRVEHPRDDQPEKSSGHDQPEKSDDQPEKSDTTNRKNLPGNYPERTTTTSQSSTYAGGANADDDRRSQSGSRAGIPTVQLERRRANEAIGSLVERHLADRELASGPVRNPDAWRTTDRRRVEQDHAPRLARLAREHPELTGEGLAELVEPATVIKPRSRPDTPLDGMQQASMARAQHGMTQIKAIVAEPPPPPRTVASGLAAARSALRSRQHAGP